MKKFSILNFQFSIAVFRPEDERRASTIGPTCAFDAKIYKNVGCIFNVSALLILSKKNFNFFHFCSALSSVLVDFSAQQ